MPLNPVPLNALSSLFLSFLPFIFCGLDSRVVRHICTIVILRQIKCRQIVTAIFICCLLIHRRTISELCSMQYCPNGMVYMLWGSALSVESCYGDCIAVIMCTWFMSVSLICRRISPLKG